MAFPTLSVPYRLRSLRVDLPALEIIRSDSYASIVLERLPKIIPKREVSYFAHVQRPERICIAQTQHRTISGSRLRLKQSIVLPR
jgi:hypothetical protein